MDFNNTGIYGPLIQELGKIYTLLDSHNARPYFIVGNSSTYTFLTTIWKGVRFCQDKTSTKSFKNLPYSKNEAWLEDKHIDCLVFLLELQNYRNPHHEDITVPIVADNHFYPTLLHNTTDALFRLRIKLVQFNVLSDQGWTAKILLFPVALNHHWILIYLNCDTHTFWAIDPYAPTHPSQEYLDIAYHIAQAIQHEFGLPEFSMNMPWQCSTFPTQDDGYNCGIYVLWYLCLFILKDINIDLPIQYDADMFRMLFSAWIFYKSIIPVNESCSTGTPTPEQELHLRKQEEVVFNT